MQSPIANIGKSIRKAKKPSGPKSIFASKISPTNHADKVAVMASRYIARSPFKLNITTTIDKRNTKNNKIKKENHLFPIHSRYICLIKLYAKLMYKSMSKGGARAITTLRDKLSPKKRWFDW